MGFFFLYKMLWDQMLFLGQIWQDVFLNSAYKFIKLFIRKQKFNVFYLFLNVQKVLLHFAFFDFFVRLVKSTSPNNNCSKLK